MKSLVISALIILVILLSYRIFDLGVSLTYANNEIEILQREILIISEFQGRNCDEIIDNDSSKEDIFLKDGNIVIYGMEFECRDRSSGRGLFFVIDGNE